MKDYKTRLLQNPTYSTSLGKYAELQFKIRKQC